MLKKVRKDKTPDINGLLYKVYLMFIVLLEILYNHWMDQACCEASMQEQTEKRQDLVIFSS